MKKSVILTLMVALCIYGCEKGSTGPSGPTGPAGPTVPTYQMTFENGVYPDSGYSGIDTHWVNGSNQSTAPGTGEIQVGTGATTANVQLGLFRANLSYKFPSNATVTGAYLQLTTETTSTLASGTTYVFGVHSIINICAPGNCPWDDSANWLQVYPDFGAVGWTGGSSGPITPGVDYNSTPLSTVTVTPSQVNGNQVPLAWNLPVSVVQPWTNPANSGVIYGLCISSEPETGNGSGYISFWDNTGTAEYKPQVIVSYTIP